MRIFKFLKIHKLSILSWLLVAAAAALGADTAFAMAVDPVIPAENPNPSENMDPASEQNPNGRPADEAAQPDEQGNRTQKPGSANTATDARDAGLLAEDYDEQIVNFRKFRFPEETLIARLCTPVKAKDYIHKHWVVGSTDLDAKFLGTGKGVADIVIDPSDNKTIAANGYKWDKAKHTLSVPASMFSNPGILQEFSTVIVENVEGYKKDKFGNQVGDGELVLFVLNHKTEDEDPNVVFEVINYPVNAGTTVTIPALATLHVMASAASESQMNVPSDGFNPVDAECTLQKKLETIVITDAMEDSNKKVNWRGKQAIAKAEENFKRKCSRSHLMGTDFRIQVWVPELNAREDVFGERGMLRQIRKIYTLANDELTDDDLLALHNLMYTINASTDHAYALCGTKFINRLIKLVNSADKYKDVGKVEVNDYGIKVRNYKDNFGWTEFIYAQSMDDVGKSDYCAIIDFKNAERPYMVNDKKTKRDMSKTGEAREAKEYNFCRIDCVDLKGHNAVLVCPASLTKDAVKLGGHASQFQLWSKNTLPTAEDGSLLMNYILKQAIGDFKANDCITYDSINQEWALYTGEIA